MWAEDGATSALSTMRQEFGMKTTFAAEFWRAAKEAPRAYFAPVVWAIWEVRAEWRRSQSGVKRDHRGEVH